VQKKKKLGNEEDGDEAEKRAYENFMRETGGFERTSFNSQETSKILNLDGTERSENQGLIKKPHQPQPGQKFYLKRTRTIMNEDGRAAQVIDIITNPTEVKQVLEKHKRQISSGSKRFAPHLSEEDEQKKILMKKEKRRLQEKMRRQKKIQLNQKFLQERYKQGSKDGTLPGGNVTLKCGRCGMFGHMKTNKSCPVFIGDDETTAKEKEKTEKKERGEKREREGAEKKERPEKRRRREI